MKVLKQSTVQDVERDRARSRLYANYRSRDDSQEELTQRAPYLEKLIRQRFPGDRNVRVLDVGCGAGALLVCLQRAGYRHLEGVDTVMEQVAIAQRLGLEVSHADAFTFLQHAPSEKYDVIACFDVLEHLNRSELLQLTDEVYRTLAPNGSWIIHTANAEGFFGSRIRYADLTHEQAFTRESLAQLAAVAGFRSCDSFEDEPVVHGVASMLRWFVWKVGRSLLGVYFTAETGERARNAILSQNLLAVVKK
jgi:2-polyprenyl-3-methyl-5-hydroxy-6-metoxy-1,4-benzoquinol methylase